MKIAITGGIGSGKSTVAAIIKEQGYPVFSCDEIYAELLKDEGFCRRICEITGTSLQKTARGTTIDRAAVSAVVFSSPTLKAALDAYTHPAIMSALIKAMNAAGATSFAEVPLLFEGGFQNLFDGVIVVMRDREQRVRSLCTRSGLSREQALSRMKNQFDYENSTLNGHTLIYNDGSVEELARKVRTVLSEIVGK